MSKTLSFLTKETEKKREKNTKQICTKNKIPVWDVLVTNLMGYEKAQSEWYMD